ncbi:hypothetical protein N7453_006077 [Penicillium expansum]|nr:hypothetical protein N7453_006077 [Penicillium expansum]
MCGTKNYGTSRILASAPMRIWVALQKDDDDWQPQRLHEPKPTTWSGCDVKWRGISRTGRRFP